MGGATINGGGGDSDLRKDVRGTLLPKKKGGRPRKEKLSLVDTPLQWNEDEEFKMTAMQSAFVWHYTEGACTAADAARKAGFSFPAATASRFLNGRDYPNVLKAIRFSQQELREKNAISPEKNARFLYRIAEASFESGAYNAAVSAIKELNQLGGLTVHRSQNLNITANVDAMDQKQIKDRLQHLLSLNTKFEDTDH